VAAPAKRLTETEGMILAAATYLHDVGMYYGRSPYDDATMRREHHHELSRHLILGTGIDGAEDYWPILNLTQARGKRILDEIATVARGHRRVDLGRTDFDDAPDPAGTGGIRLRLLAALLRLADGLDQDFHRVRYERTEIQQVDETSRGHWLKHHFVRQIKIADDRRVNVHLSIPDGTAEDGKLVGLLSRATQADVRRALDETDEVLFDAEVQLRFGAVRAHARSDVAPPTPEEFQLLEEYAEKAERSVASAPRDAGGFATDVLFASTAPVPSADSSEAERQVSPAVSATSGLATVSAVSPRLRAVLRARATALVAPGANAELVLGNAEFLGSDCTAFWFLQYLRTTDWLKRISKPLIQLVGQSYGRIHWPAMRMLCDMAKDLGHKEEVLSSGLIEAFWHSAHPFGVNWALLIIEAAEAWHAPRVGKLLDTVESPLPHSDIQRVAYNLVEYAAPDDDDEAAGTVLDYIVRCYAATPLSAHRSSYHPFFVSLDGVLRRFISAHPTVVLGRVEDLLKSEAGAQPEETAARELWRALPSGYDNALSVQISALLKQALADDALREKAEGILGRFAESGELLKQLIVIDVLRDADEKILSRMAPLAESVVVLRRPLQGLFWSEWTRYLLGRFFALGEDEVTSRLRSALLALPDETKNEGHPGAVKYFALETIPPDARTDAVNKALEGLCPPGQEGKREYKLPRKPMDQIRLMPLVDEPDRDVDFARLLGADDHGALLAAMGDVSTDAEANAHYAFDRSSTLRQALEDRPALIVPTAQMMAAAETDIAEDYYEAVAVAAGAVARSSTEFDGSAALELATALDRKSTGRALSYVAEALSRKWDDLDENEQTRALSLVCRWADPAVVSDPTVEWSEEWMARPNTGDAADTGLNSARGGIGVALVEIAGKVEGDLREQALGRIMLLLEDPAVPVRAIMLVWLRNLVGKVDGGWFAEAVSTATRDDDLRVIPCAAELLAHMEIEAILKTGVELVRQMLVEEGDTAGKGGQLAAIWSLRHPDEKQLDDLIKTVLEGANTDAKVAAAAVFAFNICAEDERIQETCRERCLEILRTQPSEVRVSVVGHLPSGKNASPLTPALGVLRLAAQDADSGVLRALWDHVLELDHDKARAQPDVVAAIIEGVLANGSEQLQAEFLRMDEGYLLAGTYQALQKGGHEALTLDLLDAACYHCVPQAKPLLDEYASSASPSGNPKP